MLKTLFVGITSILLIGGCTATQTSTRYATQSKFIDYSKVKPENHATLAVKYAENVLRGTMMDPDAMRLDTSETADMLKLGICQSNETSNGNRYKLWATTVVLNATNVRGQYTGKKPYTLFFNDGEIIASQQADGRKFDDEPVAGGFYFPCDSVE